VKNGLDVTEKADADLLSIAGNASPADTSATGLSEKDKKVRNLEKKIRQIRELKERQSKGDTLEATQVSRIDMNEAGFFFFFF
jgi:translation initiation factor 2A